jgi:hypothetical protein
LASPFPTLAPDETIRLIVNADDFGSSESANTAIEQAHREGILTSASLMVNGNLNPEAVWYYPEPFEAAKQIKGRVAFWKGVTVTP